MPGGGWGRGRWFVSEERCIVEVNFGLSHCARRKMWRVVVIFDSKDSLIDGDSWLVIVVDELLRSLSVVADNGACGCRYQRRVPG